MCAASSGVMSLGVDEQSVWSEMWLLQIDCSFDCQEPSPKDAAMYRYVTYVRCRQPVYLTARETTPEVKAHRWRQKVEKREFSHRP